MEMLNAGRMLQCQRAFVAEREWQTFHTPKNLSMALTIEAAELMEIFQWLSPAEARRIMKDRVKAREVTEELADIFYYLLRLADTLAVDLEQAFWSKMAKNRTKYPAHLARGNAKKYQEFLQRKGLHRRGPDRVGGEG
jgi:NTP pyrophosphatase (non-canonical NTP hydrolase)